MANRCQPHSAPGTTQRAPTSSCASSASATKTATASRRGSARSRVELDAAKAVVRPPIPWELGVYVDGHVGRLAEAASQDDPPLEGSVVVTDPCIVLRGQGGAGLGGVPGTSVRVDHQMSTLVDTVATSANVDGACDFAMVCTTKAELGVIEYSGARSRSGSGRA